MTYQVLARKWRPQNFTDMVGQDHISSTLCNAIKNNRVGHAYLFVGTRGTGKTTTARIFAKAINCENPLPDANPCNKCGNCLEITAGSSMDVLEIDGASNNGVDDIRRLRDNVQYTPARCKFKVYIIDEVHMLSTAAWNALLKTLEEPPEHVKFLFATTEVHKVLPTILSRCQRFDLKRISQGTIARRLQEIAQEENARFDSSALNSIARAANGGMRDALSIMDQMIAFCSDQELISEHDVSEVFGLTSTYDLAKIMSAMLTDNAKQLISEINRLSDMGRNLEQLYSDLLRFCRNLMICAISKENATDILDLDEHDLQMAQTIVQQSSADTIQKLMDGFLTYDGKLRSTLNKRVFMEMTLVRVMKDAHAVSLNDILARINHLRKNGSLDALEGEIQIPAKEISLPEPQKKNDLTPAPTLEQTPIKVVKEETVLSPPEESTPEPVTQEFVEAPETIESSIEEREDPPAETEPKVEDSITPAMPAEEPLVEVQDTIPSLQESQIKQEAVVEEKFPEPAAAVKTKPNPVEAGTEKQVIDDSYDLPYSTLIDSDYIADARINDPLNLGIKKIQGNFDENAETPGASMGLFYEVSSSADHEHLEEKKTEDSIIPEITPEVEKEIPEEEPPSLEVKEEKEEYIPEQAPPSLIEKAQDTHEVISKQVFSKVVQETPETVAESFWQRLSTNDQSSKLKSILQHLSPVSYQENRFYAAYETGGAEIDETAKQLLEGELKKLTNNSALELMLVGASKDVENDKPALSSGEDVWSRVQSNPLFTDICKEFDGKIIDVRG